MMIAFITINSGLVPLIEGLRAQILIIKDLRLSVVCVHILCFFFRKKKYVKEKSSKSKISSRLLAYTYTCVAYIYT